MSSKKITNWNASSIAKRISEKAFNHLLKPFKSKINEYLRQCYEEAMRNIDVKWLLDHGFAEQCRMVTINLHDGYGNEECLNYREINSHVENDDDDDDTHNGSLVRPSRWNTQMTITNEEYFLTIKNVLNQMKPYEEQCNKLQDELAKQLRNKTVTQACKAWPEAASIIRDSMGVTNDDRPMDVPLEQLLGKFLLALPAPQAA